MSARMITNNENGSSNKHRSLCEYDDKNNWQVFDQSIHITIKKTNNKLLELSQGDVYTLLSTYVTYQRERNQLKLAIQTLYNCHQCRP